MQVRTRLARVRVKVSPKSKLIYDTYIVFHTNPVRLQSHLCPAISSFPRSSGSLLPNSSSISRRLLPSRLCFPAPLPLSVSSPSQLSCLSRPSSFSVDFCLNVVVSPSAVDFCLNGLIFFSDVVFLCSAIVPSSSLLISTDLPPFPLHSRSSALSHPFLIFLPFLSLCNNRHWIGASIAPFPLRLCHRPFSSPPVLPRCQICLAASHLPALPHRQSPAWMPALPCRLLSTDMLISGLIVMFEKINMI